VFENYGLSITRQDFMCREYSLWFGLKVGLMVYGLGCMDLGIRFRVQPSITNAILRPQNERDEIGTETSGGSAEASLEVTMVTMGLVISVA